MNPVAFTYGGCRFCSSSTSSEQTKGNGQQEVWSYWTNVAVLVTMGIAGLNSQNLQDNRKVSIEKLKILVGVAVASLVKVVTADFTGSAARTAKNPRSGVKGSCARWVERHQGRLVVRHGKDWSGAAVSLESMIYMDSSARLETR
ncbi:hypothetical protein NL676_039353 [Syzygium grande]|nr:hypothetical protein NL676_039353 [Syzygium grande]